MKKAIKIVSALILIPVLLVVIGITGLVLFVDPNDYKAELERMAAERNIVLNIEGDIEWSFFPRLGLRTGKLSVLPDTDALNAPVGFESMDIAIKVMPLLSGELIADHSQIHGGHASIVDKHTGNTTTVEKLTLTGRGINLKTSAFPLNIAFKLHTTVPEQHIDVSLDTSLSLDNTLQKIRLISSEGVISYQGEPTNNIVYPLNIKAAADVDLGAQTVAINELVLKLFEFTANGKFTVKAFQTNPAVNGNLELSIDGINTLLKNLGQAPIETSDSTVMQTFKLNTLVQANSKKAALNNIELKLDDTTFTGDISAELGEVPYLIIKLAGDSLNADRYLPPATDNENQGTQAASEPAASPSNEPLIPVEQVTALPGQYSITLEQLIVSNLKLTNNVFNTNISPQGMVSLNSLATDLYQGRFNASGTLDAAQAQPPLTLKAALSPIQLEPLLMDLTESEQPYASGNFKFSSNITTKGVTEADILQNLNGQLDFNSTSLTLNEIDMTGELNDALAELLRMELPGLMNSGDKTVMENVVGQSTITNGVVNNTVLSATSLCTAFNGNGQFDLNQQSLLYNMDLVFPSTDTNAACAEINTRLKDVPWPVQCRGFFSDDPASLCGVNQKRMSQTVEKIVKKEAGRKVEKKLEETLKDKIGGDDEVKNLLKGLFN